MRFPFGLLLALLLVSSGCQSQPATSDMLASSAGPERMRALARLAEQKRWENVPTFIRFLDDPDVSVRWVAIQSLFSQTGADLGFRPDDPPETRAPIVALWNEWWRTEGVHGRSARPPSASS